MYFAKKLRSPVLGTEAIIGITAAAAFIMLLILSFKIAMMFGACITFFAGLISLIALLRTRNMYFLYMVLFQLFATIMLVMISFLEIELYRFYIIPVAGMMGIFMTIMLIATIQRKYKWYTREVLELAAAPVNELNGAFTARPMQTGKINASRAEIFAYANFIRRNLIAIPVQDHERIIFVVNIPFTRFLLYSGKYDDRSWVSFDLDGNVTASISQHDYFMYRDMLAFDQLVNNLGQLFIEFFEKYQRGEAIMIMHELSSVNIKPI